MCFPGMNAEVEKVLRSEIKKDIRREAKLKEEANELEEKMNQWYSSIKSFIFSEGKKKCKDR